MLDQRTTQIVKKILESSYISKDDLINSCSLTKRQLEYSIKKINDYLKDNNLQQIRFVKNNISIKEETHNFLLNSIRIGEEKNYLLSNTERSKYLFLIILSSRCFLSMYHFIYALDVSKSTVIKDLKALEKSLAKLHIAIKYSRKKGYYLSGDEGHIRYYLMKLIITCVAIDNNKRLLDLFIKKDKLEPFNNKYNLIVKLAHKHHISFVENRLVEFVYTVILLQQRLRINPKYIANEFDTIKLSQTNEYFFSKELIEKSKDLTEESLPYICTWLLGVSEINIIQTDEDFKEIYKIVDDILVRFEFLSGIVFEDRNTVKNQIFLHFRTVHYRLLFKLPILNPLFSRIKKQYEELYILVKEAMKDYEQKFQLKLPDDETAYLVIHFASIIEQLKVKKKKEIVAIVTCPDGLGSSMIMYTQLKSLFPDFTFLEPISNMDLKVKSSQVDIIFSTTSNVQLLEIDKPSFIVNPIMTIAEKYRLIRDVHLEIGHNFFKFPNIHDIIKIIDKYVEVEYKSLIEKELFHTILGTDSVVQEANRPLLSEIVKESFVQLNIEVTNKYDAVKIASKPLLEAGAISTQYVDKIIQTLEKNSRYMVITKGVALPHGKIEFGALELAIGITVLKNSINFNNKKNDPVKYIFCLSVIDKDRHLTALSSLVNLLSCPEFYNILNRATTQREIISFIHNWEHNEIKNKTY